MPAVSLLRARSGVEAVTNIEVFFDLVYAFAVIQLSHYLLEHATVEGALQTALLLAMVWVVWASTTYLANWLNPDRPAFRCWSRLACANPASPSAPSPWRQWRWL